MKNREKWAEEILSILMDEAQFAVKDGEPVRCTGRRCVDCDFYVAGNCDEAMREWAEQEAEDKETAADELLREPETAAAVSDIRPVGG